MINIVLLCAGGMSTSILAKNIEEAALELGFECKVNAYGVPKARDVVPEADIVLIGPQVQFAINKLKKEFPTKDISVIDMRDYGMMAGKNVINTIKERLALIGWKI